MTNKKNVNNVSMGIGFDTSLLKKNVDEIIRIISHMTSRISKEFTRMSKMSISGYTPIEERKKSYTAEGTASYKASLEDEVKRAEALRDAEVKRRKNLIKSAKTDKTVKKHENAIFETERFYNQQIAELQDKIDNIDVSSRERIADMANAVRTKYSTKVKDGFEVAKEEQYERYLPSKYVKDAKNKDVELLAKEIQYVKTIRDLKKGTEKIVTRTLVQEQELTNAGKKYKTIADDTVETEEKLTAEQLRQAKVNKKRGPLGTFLARFKSVAIYRFIRNIIKEIGTAFSESLSGIAIKSDVFNDSFSQITSSITQLKTSMGVAFYQILIALQPLITSLSAIIVRFANSISYLTAKIQGQNTFLKVNEEYFKNYRDSLHSALLEFDTFTTLQQNGPDYDKLLDETKVEEFSINFSDIVSNINDALEGLTGIDNALVGVLATLTALGSAAIIKWIKSGGIKNLFLDVGPVAALIVSIYQVIKGISDIFNWDEITKGLTDTQKALKAVATALQITFGIMAAIAAVKAIINPTAAGVGLAIGGAVLSFAAGAISKNIKGYANGGNFRTGDFFVANENGSTEMIASTNSGGSVMNLEQWAQVSEVAVYNALSKYGASQNGQSVNIDINKMGTAIARNSGFVNEMNRRNVGLGLV